MTGSRPKPSVKTVSRTTAPKVANARRYPKNMASIPGMTVGALFGLYILIGLLLSVPMPPLWTWIPTIVGTALLTIGLNSPMASGKSHDRVGLLTYVGAFLLVVALAIAANYIGGKPFENISFFLALLGFAFLTLLSVGLTAAAAIISAQTGASLMQKMDHKRSMTVLLSTCFCGALLGGVIGLVLSLALGASAR
jgi:hypothetical protein